MRREKIWILGLLMGVACLGLLACPAAATSTIVGNTLTLAALDGTDLTVYAGDKCFSDFEVTNNPNGIDLTKVVISGIYEADVKELGISIDLDNQMTIIGVGAKDLGLEYTVTSYGPKITDNTLTMAGGIFGNDGTILVSETPREPGVNGRELTQKLVFNLGPLGGVTSVHKIYTVGGVEGGVPEPVRTAVITKDIFVGNTDPNGIVFLSDVEQTFSQQTIPEPVTMLSGLLVISGLGAYIRRRMKAPVA